MRRRVYKSHEMNVEKIQMTLPPACHTPYPPTPLLGIADLGSITLTHLDNLLSMIQYPPYADRHHLSAYFRQAHDDRFFWENISRPEHDSGESNPSRWDRREKLGSHTYKSSPFLQKSFQKKWDRCRSRYAGTAICSRWSVHTVSMTIPC